MVDIRGCNQWVCVDNCTYAVHQLLIDWVIDSLYIHNIYTWEIDCFAVSINISVLNQIWSNWMSYLFSCLLPEVLQGISSLPSDLVSIVLFILFFQDLASILYKAAERGLLDGARIQQIFGVSKPGSDSGNLPCKSCFHIQGKIQEDILNSFRAY